MGVLLSESAHLRWFALLLLGALAGSAQEPPPVGAEWNDVATSIVPDSSLATQVEASGTIWTIPESPGERAGQNLFHSFERFDLGSGDRARFTANAPTLHIINRITGERASRLNGILDSSEISGADLYFLNPRGVFFGPSARLDVDASFHASSADFLIFANAETLQTQLGAEAPLLSVSSPSSFGFSGAETIGTIAIEASLLSVPDGYGLSFTAGDIDIVAGKLLAGTASANATPGIFLDARGDLLIRDDPASGENSLLWAPSDRDAAGGGMTLRADRDVILLNSNLESFSLASGRGGDISIDAGAFLVMHGVEARSSASGSGDAGNITLRAGGAAHLSGSKLDASVIDLPSGSPLPGGAGGTIRIEVGDGEAAPLAARGEAPESDLILDETTLLVANQGNSPREGRIEILGERITLKGGSLLGAVPASSDAAGTNGNSVIITLEALESIALLGSGISTGTGSDTSGSITLRAPAISLMGAGVIASTTYGNEDAGPIQIEATTIKLADGFGIVGNTLGVGGDAGRGADILLRADHSLSLGDEVGIHSSTLGDGGAGSITLGGRNSELPNIELRGASVTALADLGLGDAGTIEIEARQLSLSNGSAVLSASRATRTETGGARPGSAGSVTLSANEIRLGGGSGISVYAEVGPDVPADLGPGDPSPPGAVEGNVAILARDLLELEGGSQIRASVGTGLGGSIAIGTPSEPSVGVVLRERSVLLARARGEETRASSGPAARGGEIRINAEAVFACPECFINADGPTTQSAGSVAINHPESAIESQALPPNVSYLDASAQLLARCGAGGPDPGEFGDADGNSRFTVARWPGLRPSPEGPLLALSPLESGLGVEYGDVGTPPRDRTPGPVANLGKNAPRTQDPEATTPLLLAMRGGHEALRGGRGQRAGAAFIRAEGEAAAQGNTGARGDALRGLAEARQISGAYAESLAPLEEALGLARRSGDPLREAAALGALGNAYVALAEFERAETLLTRAVDVSRGERGRDLERAGLVAALLNNLGNQRAIAGHGDAALKAYRESAREARAAGSALRSAQAEANAARTALELGRPDQTRAALRAARQSLAAAELAPAEDTALRIHLAHTESSLARREPSQRRSSRLAAHADLLRAGASAEALGDLRSASHALGNLGALYAEEPGREREAVYLTRRALQLAEDSQAADLMGRWYAQAGQLGWREGRREEALDAYRRAVALLDETRPEASAGYGNVDLAFRQAVEPVYLALVDALLRSSEAPMGKSARQARLSEARQVVEQWKAAELRNYFHDSCAAETPTRNVDTVDPRAAVIYPISLPDRLELLVGRASGIARYTVPLPADELNRQVERFLRTLGKRTSAEYRRPAKTLYDQLVAPYASALEAEGIDTLVFVPGGALRTVPMAALYDGERFLLERFAVAITPSLNLLAPEPLVAREAHVLLAGVSEAVQGFPALPAVPGELAAIEELFGGDVLLDRDFDVTSLQKALRNRPPGVVHIASHAEFTGDPESSFVLTHGDRLSMEQLSSLLRAGRYGEEPVELLMLSACETAVGDERAALGLAGVAIRAGARSAMGSLWTVSDEATAALVVGFYRALGERGISKAQALRRAQQELRADARFDHPFYWAPFMVINNWL